jgi:hypothetical protein
MVIGIGIRDRRAYAQVVIKNKVQFLRRLDASKQRAASVRVYVVDVDGNGHVETDSE